MSKKFVSRLDKWLHKEIISIILSCLILFLSTGIILGLPKALNFVSSNIVSANNISQNEAVLGAHVQLLITPTPTAIPSFQSMGLTPPSVSANAALVVDFKTGKDLYAKNPNLQVAIASTTKLMTALTALQYYRLDEVLTVPYIADIDGSLMGLEEGEKITFLNILYGLFLNSGNDAAYTLARDYPGGESAFVAKMNQNAKDWGLLHTNFENPAGFDNPYHFSSAYDLSQIATRVAENPVLPTIFGTKTITVTSEDGIIVHNLKNLNELLGKDGVIGMKTGTTPQAKENLIGLINKDNREILTVVLGSDYRFVDTKALIDWTYKNYKFF